MTATIFALTTLEDGRRVGHGVICVDARYCSVQWHGSVRLERRFVALDLWARLGRALGEALESGPLPADGSLAEALLEPSKRRDLVVQYLARVPVSEGPTVATNLDGLLRGLAPVAFRLQQT